jgi:hypothetical protein
MPWDGAASPLCARFTRGPQNHQLKFWWATNHMTRHVARWVSFIHQFSQHNNERFKIISERNRLTIIKTTAFWDVAPCSLVGTDQCFRVVHRPEDEGSKNLSNVGQLLPNYTVQQLRRHFHTRRRENLKSSLEVCLCISKNLSTKFSVLRELYCPVFSRKQWLRLNSQSA